MREIKFRAWDGETMLYMNDGEHIADFFNHIHIKENIFGKDVTYEQYTGLKDKNGKEIYEGDVITGWTMAKEIVSYDERNARFLPVWLQLWNDDIRDAKTEILGNIYENPELV